MKNANPNPVTRFTLIAIGAMLTVPLPAVAKEIHGDEIKDSVSLGTNTLTNLTTGDTNTASGSYALNKNTTGSANTASGSDALRNNITGDNNTASGSRALYSNTGGIDNTASGSKALYGNTEGIDNTASGARALYSNTEGIDNTASGARALFSNITGDNNTASGSRALYSNTEGIDNTASGARALYSNTEGIDNTASGARTLFSNITGDNNTAIGYRAGGFNESGSKNVFIGYQAGDNVGYTNKSNQLVIGNGPLPGNQLVIGDFSKRTLLINGRTSINGDAIVRGDLKVQGKAFAASFEKSDGRLKKDIKPLSHALDSILQLQGKTYRWKEGATFNNKKDIGLIAQDVEKVFPELVAEDEQGYKAIAYSKLTTVLIEAIKEQQGQITTLEKENTLLKTIMAEQMDALLARVAMLEGETLVAN